MKSNALFWPAIALILMGVFRTIAEIQEGGTIDLAALCAFAAGAMLFVRLKWLRFTALVLLVPTFFFAAYDLYSEGLTSLRIGRILLWALFYGWIGSEIWKHHDDLHPTRRFS